MYQPVFQTEIHHGYDININTIDGTHYQDETNQNIMNELESKALFTNSSIKHLDYMQGLLPNITRDNLLHI